MSAVLAARCRARKCKHFADCSTYAYSQIANLALRFLKPIDSILFKYRDKSLPVNFAKYDIMPYYNIEIVSCDVI